MGALHQTGVTQLELDSMPSPTPDLVYGAAQPGRGVRSTARQQRYSGRADQPDLLTPARWGDVPEWQAMGNIGLGVRNTRVLIEADINGGNTQLAEQYLGPTAYVAGAQGVTQPGLEAHLAKRLEDDFTLTARGLRTARAAAANYVSAHPEVVARLPTE